MGIRVFYSYSHKDERYREILESHLAILRRQGLVQEWNDRKIAPGSNWKEEINLNLQKAKIVLLLVSSNFLASDYCYETETIFALEQHSQKKCVVVPIIIKPCSWKETHFKHLQVLPKDGRPVITWRIRDEAWVNVEQGIRKVIKDHCAIMDARDYSDIHLGSNNINHKNVSVDELLLQFLSTFSGWYFSPLRIQKWGGQQRGFETLNQLSTEEIRKKLKNFQYEGAIKTTKSKKGNLLYKIDH